MNFKTSAIALAVAGTVAAPVAVQAGADEIYASARVGLESYDTGGVSDLRVRSFASRFGMRGETDLGNGMTGFGRYEWDVDFNLDTGEDDIGLRHRYVGLKGDFGSVTIGQTYQTFYNHVVGPNDIPWWSSGYAMIDYVGRTGNAITYAGSTGAVSFGATAYFVREGAEDAPDGIELGASFGIGDMTLGVAMRNTAADVAAGTGAQLIGNGSDEDVIGLALTGIALGDASLGLGFQSQDDDTSFLIHVDIGSLYVHFETESLDLANQDPSMITLGYTQSLGRKTTAYYEFMEYDADSGNSDDDITAIRGVLKYDII